MEWLTSPEIWVAFLTLTALEIVLGIDNIIMIAILVGRMPPHMQARTRFFGLALAMVTRIALLLSITWIMKLTNDLFHLFGQGISGRDLILFFGGLFLLWKSSTEMFHSLEGEDETEQTPGNTAARNFIGTISDFIDKHPSLKMLALAFLVVVGTVLIAEAFEVHVPKGYVYFAMAFSLGVEALNIRMRVLRGRKEDPVKLRKDIPGQ